MKCIWEMSDTSERSVVMNWTTEFLVGTAKEVNKLDFFILENAFTSLGVADTISLEIFGKFNKMKI